MTKLTLKADIWGEVQTPLFGSLPFNLKKGTHQPKSEEDEAVFAFLAETRPDLAKVGTDEPPSKGDD